MRTVLLGAAALLAAVAVPASANAQRPGGAGFTSANSHVGSAVRVHRGERDLRRDGDFERERGRDHRRRDGQGDAYFPYRDYQGDTLWRPESFNDWWHERPNRSYPAWVARNSDCERLWWSGGGWRC